MRVEISRYMQMNRWLIEHGNQRNLWTSRFYLPLLQFACDRSETTSVVTITAERNPIFDKTRSRPWLCVSFQRKRNKMRFTRFLLLSFVGLSFMCFIATLLLPKINERNLIHLPSKTFSRYAEFLRTKLSPSTLIEWVTLFILYTLTPFRFKTQVWWKEYEDNDLKIRRGKSKQATVG